VTVGDSSLVLLFVAIVFDAALGSIPGLRQVLDAPRGLITRLARWFDLRLNRPERSAGARGIRGGLVVLVLAGLGWALGVVLKQLFDSIPQGGWFEVAVLAFLPGVRMVAGRLWSVARDIRANELAPAVIQVSRLVRHDPVADDVHALARAAISGGAARFCEGLAGTAVWYILLGLPGVIAYRVIGAVADAIGRDSPRLRAFGFAARRLDDVLSLPAALIMGPFILVAALFVPGARPVAAVGEWWRDLCGRGLRGAWRAEGAVAGALALSLGGPHLQEGDMQPGAWIGGGRARAEDADIRRAAILLSVTLLIVLITMALIIRMQF
jgi:adenosylcobinamide-phosphate synthase